jgi:hypothetical protein
MDVPAFYGRSTGAISGAGDSEFCLVVLAGATCKKGVLAPSKLR